MSNDFQCQNTLQIAKSFGVEIENAFNCLATASSRKAIAQFLDRFLIVLRKNEITGPWLSTWSDDLDKIGVEKQSLNDRAVEWLLCKLNEFKQMPLYEYAPTKKAIDRAIRYIGEREAGKPLDPNCKIYLSLDDLVDDSFNSLPYLMCCMERFKDACESIARLGFKDVLQELAIYSERQESGHMRLPHGVACGQNIVLLYGAKNQVLPLIPNYEKYLKEGYVSIEIAYEEVPIDFSSIDSVRVETELSITYRVNMGFIVKHLPPEAFKCVLFYPSDKSMNALLETSPHRSLYLLLSTLDQLNSGSAIAQGRTLLSRVNQIEQENQRAFSVLDKPEVQRERVLAVASRLLLLIRSTIDARVSYTVDEELTILLSDYKDPKLRSELNKYGIGRMRTLARQKFKSASPLDQKRYDSSHWIDQAADELLKACHPKLESHYSSKRAKNKAKSLEFGPDLKGRPPKKNKADTCPSA